MKITKSRRKTSAIWINNTDDEFAAIVANSFTYTEVLKKLGYSGLGGSRETLNERISHLNIDTTHFDPYKYPTNRNGQTAIDLDKILVKDSTYSRKSLKARLLKLSILKNECSICDLPGKWNGKDIVMIIDHINGVNNDNRLSNLRMVCPNCNSQLTTHGGRNRKKTIKKVKVDIKCISCDGNANYSTSGLCTKCYKQPSNRAPKSEIECDLMSLPLIHIGKKYGVSDNAVRKWLKYYNLPIKFKDIQKWKSEQMDR